MQPQHLQRKAGSGDRARSSPPTPWNRTAAGFSPDPTRPGPAGGPWRYLQPLLQAGALLSASRRGGGGARLTGALLRLLAQRLVQIPAAAAAFFFFLLFFLFFLVTAPARRTIGGLRRPRFLRTHPLRPHAPRHRHPPGAVPGWEAPPPPPGSAAAAAGHCGYCSPGRTPPPPLGAAISCPACRVG